MPARLRRLVRAGGRFYAALRCFHAVQRRREQVQDEILKRAAELRELDALIVSWADTVEHLGKRYGAESERARVHETNREAWLAAAVERLELGLSPPMPSRELIRREQGR